MLNSLKSEIGAAVSRFCRDETCAIALNRALTRPGYALNPESQCRAGVLTLSVNTMILGSLNEVSLLAAVGVEMQMEAAFMFDDVADQEIDTESEMDSAEQLALAIGLMSCGSAAASEAVSRAGFEEASSSGLTEFHTNFVGACAGQFLDANLAKKTSIGVDQAILMTTLKSGSLGKFAAAFGARVATEDPEIIDLCGDFGLNLFTYLQLVDDLRDACPTYDPPLDFTQHKQTIPLVYFYNYLEESGILYDDIMHQSGIEGPDSEFRAHYQKSGADLFSAIIGETYLNRAKSSLENLKSLIGRTERLERFVHSLEISPEELFRAA